MSERLRPRAAVTVLAAVSIVAAACGGGGGGKSSGKNKGGTAPVTAAVNGVGQVNVNPLFVSTDASGHSTGGTNPVTVRIAASPDQKLRVGFSEDEVAGTGDQWRAAGWGAVTVATLITGAPLSNRDVEFDVNGKIDGPSAGGLMTVAVLSILRGDPLLPDVTMTGTINPDGTIGPVGGIPYKVDGVVKAGKKRMLVPTGQRNSADDSGKLVDVVQEGQQKGVQVTEVSNIYDAYKAFTGKDLPRPAPAQDVKLDEASYQKLKAKVETWLARYKTALGDFKSLDPSVQSELKTLAAGAQQDASQSQKLTDEGLQAGAFVKALQAAALENAVVKVGQQVQVLIDQGIDAFVSKIKASASISGEVGGLVDDLKTYQPKTVSDAGALISAFGNAVDAESFAQFGQNLLDARASNEQQAIGQVVEGAVFYELAGSIVDAARDVLDVGRDLGGASLGPGIDLHDVSEFFRRAGEANLNAFETLIIGPAANDANVSEASAKAAFESNDIAYALSVQGLNVMGGLQQYFGDAASSDYATLGGALSLYDRAAGLIAKYYSLGDIDPKTLALTGIRNDEAYSATIDLAQSQLAGGVGELLAKQVNPTIPVADNEIATVEREGDAADKLNALSDYWDGYLNTRVLAYLGGFAAP